MSPTVIRIDDPADPRVGDYIGLTDAQLRARIEAGDPDNPADHGSFIVEGHLPLEALVASPYRVRSVLVSQPQADRVAPTLARVPAETPLFVATQAVVEATVGFHIHRGVVASAARLPPSDPLALLDAATTLLVVEGVNDHENLGGLFRNAAAFGVGAVLLDPTTADPLYRRSVRVSLGHALRVPFARLEPWPSELDAVSAAGFATVSLTPESDAPPIDAVAASLGPPGPHPSKVALLVGAEGPGLTHGALDATRHRARIPMAHGVDSLNVATAAAVALYAITSRGG